MGYGVLSLAYTVVVDAARGDDKHDFQFVQTRHNRMCKREDSKLGLMQLSTLLVEHSQCIVLSSGRRRDMN